MQTPTMELALYSIGIVGFLTWVMVLVVVLSIMRQIRLWRYVEPIPVRLSPEQRLAYKRRTQELSAALAARQLSRINPRDTREWHAAARDTSAEQIVLQIEPDETPGSSEQAAITA